VHFLTSPRFCDAVVIHEARLLMSFSFWPLGFWVSCILLSTQPPLLRFVLSSLHALTPSTRPRGLNCTFHYAISRRAVETSLVRIPPQNLLSNLEMSSLSFEFFILLPLKAVYP